MKQSSTETETVCDQHDDGLSSKHNQMCFSCTRLFHMWICHVSMTTSMFRNEFGQFTCFSDGFPQFSPTG